MSSSLKPSLLDRPIARWLRSEHRNEAAAGLTEALRLDPIVARILVSRGYETPDAAQDFLTPDLGRLHDPFLVRDMDRACTRIGRAIANREPILLYGDYDVDGACSIVVLKKAIEILGGLADFHIPHRIKEGYGMRSDVVSRALEAGFRLVVSVDTGIRSGEVVRHANAIGIDVIVTDHHLPESELPPAFAVLNPNRLDCAYPNKNLCGAGVTFKLVQALFARSTLPSARQNVLLDSFLKPVAIATVADIVPLTGENRVLVKRGLSGLSRVKNPGLRALLDVAGFDRGEPPSAHQVAFRLAPRINAGGRMATAKEVVELFLTDDLARAQQLAEHLNELNAERQRVEAEIVECVLNQCQEIGISEASTGLVFAGQAWHLGVLGIVASRLVERFSRPVFVLTETNGAGNDEICLSGSGRSIPAFHLLEALETMPELFQRFGGHRQAAGLTLSTTNLEEFRRRFNEVAADRLRSDDLRPRHSVDAEITLRDLTDRCAGQILALGPFGFGNPVPILCCNKVEVAAAPRVDSTGRHLTVPLRQNGRTLFCKAWNFARFAELFEPKKEIDVLLQLEDDPYSRKRGYGSWCVSLKDFKTSGELAGSPA